MAKKIELDADRKHLLWKMERSLILAKSFGKMFFIIKIPRKKVDLVRSGQIKFPDLTRS